MQAERSITSVLMQMAIEDRPCAIILMKGVALLLVIVDYYGLARPASTCLIVYYFIPIE